MNREITSTNTTFGILKESGEFFNLILNNITTCILLLNDRMELQAYNDALQTIFSNSKDEYVLYRRCGEVIGCAYAVDEAKQCGETSHCPYCELRVSALHAYISNENVYKKQFSRPFYTHQNEKVMKHLQFSIRLFKYELEKYIILMIEDISPLVDQQKRISELELHLRG